MALLQPPPTALGLGCRMYEVISNVPGGEDGAASYQQAMQALQQGSLEDLPAFMDGDSHMFSRRPAAVFPVNRDRCAVQPSWAAGRLTLAHASAADAEHADLSTCRPQCQQQQACPEGVLQASMHRSEGDTVCRFVLNVLERDDLQEEGQPESSSAVQEDRSTAGLGLGSSFPGLQMDDRVQVLPEGTVEAGADADIKVRQGPPAA